MAWTGLEKGNEVTRDGRGCGKGVHVELHAAKLMMIPTLAHKADTGTRELYF